MSDVKIFAEHIESSAQAQVEAFSKLVPFENEKIRIMPDVHVGKGCVIGFTSTLNSEFIMPCVIGVDIGCGILSVETSMKATPKLYKKMDKTIQSAVPTGINHHNDTSVANADIVANLIKRLSYNLESSIVDLAQRSLGTLGGGNHFIELDKHPQTSKLWLTIHTGSRNFGFQIAEHHQNIATKNGGFLSGDLAQDYLNDYKLAYEFAMKNRHEILSAIQEEMGFNILSTVESVHNCIDMTEGMIRKGAISAHVGEDVVIPLNMAAGIVLGRGKGNADWNNSAPHGAGRKMTRVAAKEKISLDQYQKDMNGVYSTCVGKKTIDESPRAYKNPKAILGMLSETVEGIVVCESVYSYKAS